MVVAQGGRDAVEDLTPSGPRGAPVLHQEQTVQTHLTGAACQSQSPVPTHYGPSAPPGRRHGVVTCCHLGHDQTGLMASQRTRTDLTLGGILLEGNPGPHYCSPGPASPSGWGGKHQQPQGGGVADADASPRGPPARSSTISKWGGRAGSVTA